MHVTSHFFPRSLCIAQGVRALHIIHPSITLQTMHCKVCTVLFWFVLYPICSPHLRLPYLPGLAHVAESFLFFIFGVVVDYRTRNVGCTPLPQCRAYYNSIRLSVGVVTQYSIVKILKSNQSCMHCEDKLSRVIGLRDEIHDGKWKQEQHRTTTLSMSYNWKRLEENYPVSIFLNNNLLIPSIVSENTYNRQRVEGPESPCTPCT